MSVMDKLRKEAKRLKEVEGEKKTFEKIDWYTPDKGDNNIRLLPHKDKPETSVPFRRVVVHYLPVKKNAGGFANIPVRCLTELDDTCPLCKKFTQLQKAGDKDGAMRMRPSERYLWNVINYKDVKVQPYSAPLTVHNELMGWVADEDSNPDGIDILSRDWRLTKKPGKGIQVDYSVRPSMKDSVIAPKMKTLLEAMVDLDSLYNDNEKTKMLAFIGEEPEADDDKEVEADEDDDKAERLAAAKAKAAKAKVKAKPEPEDEDAPEDDGDDDDGFAPAKAKKDSTPPAKGKPMSKAKPKDEEEEIEEEAEVNTDDEDLEKELRDLGVTEDSP